MSAQTLQQAFDQAVQHHRAGRIREAEAIYQQILRADPNQFETLYLLGLVERQKGHPSEAAAMWQRAASLHPERADVQHQLAWALLDANEPYQAASAARRAIERHPNSSELHSILGRTLAGIKQFDDAIAAAKRAVELQPGSGDARNDLGEVYRAAGRLSEAEAEHLEAIKIHPNVASYHRNLAAVRDAMDDVEGSIAAAEQALQLAPPDAQILTNLAALHRRRRDYRAAVDVAERALKLAPNYADAHGARAIALLSLGDYEQGFIEYEWRWRCDNFTTAARDFARPMWDGSDPSGRTIFVHTEQGFGDTIQFARYVPLLAARGAKVLLECHPSLRTLFRTIEGVTKIVPSGTRPGDFDLHTPLLSLPKWFKTTLDTVPKSVPYLHPDPQRVEVWKMRINSQKLQVGLVWSGNVKPDPHRTCPLSSLAPLGAVESVQFYSLQVGDAVQELAGAPFQIIDLSADLADFHETAAAMLALDLVISIDTAAAHLAGALGRPVWTLLPWAPDWRWMLDRDDSVWYPTMRLFRQTQKGDWRDPIERVAGELRTHTP